MSKPGDIEFEDEGKNIIKSLVTIGDGPRDAILRVEEFIREYFGDNSFVAERADEVGSIAKGTLYKVVGY